jgi:hypothetical protein
VLFLIYLAGAWMVLRAPRHGDRPREERALILWAALVFRIILLPAPPSLSDDIYRYIWEGELQLEGMNPYQYAPSDPAIVSHRDRIYEGINNKHLPAIYPPVTQWAFAAGALIGRSPLAMKTIFVAADMALILMLGALLRALRVPSARILIYAWNPLAVVEVAGSGHNDSLALFFLVASTLGIIGKRRVLSMTALAAAALSKLFPVALLPLFARRVRPWHLLVPPALMAACYLPYLSAGENLFRSVTEYAQRWRFNDSIFAVLVWAIDGSGLSTAAEAWADARHLPAFYAQPHMIARGVAALIALSALALLMARQWKSGAEPSRAIFLFTGIVLILQPTMHPWYLLWILPWLTIHPSLAWIALTGLAPLAYLEAGWVPWAEYLPFFALLAAQRLVTPEFRNRVIEFPERGRPAG